MKKLKYGLPIIAATLLLGAVGCGSNEKPYVPGFWFTVGLDSGTNAVKLGETDTVVAVAQDTKEHDWVFSSDNTDILTVDPDTGDITPVACGTTYVTVTEPDEEVAKSIKVSVYNALVSGAKAYNAASYDQRGEILGKLEKYALDHNLAGVPLFENGGLVVYSSDVRKGTPTYVNGYGWGILSDGEITADMTTESKTEWKRYYHSGTSTDLKNINALDSDNSGVSDLYDYISSAYWGTKLNANKDGYEWYGVLAKENRPVAVNPDPTSGYASKWKFHVRTGTDGLKYATTSTLRSSFNGRDVELRDYKYALMFLLNGKHNLYRGSELAEDESYAFKGSAAFFNYTKNNTTLSDAEIEAYFDKTVGFKTGTDDDGAYVEVELVKAVSPFYAMYGLASSLYEPICEDFIKAIGADKDAKNYGNFVDATGTTPATTPIDNILCLSPYSLEYWEKDKAIVFQRNSNWFQFSIPELQNRYKIPGVKISVYPGLKEDNTVLIKEFEAGKVHACGVPTSYVKKYEEDPRTVTNPGDAVFKLNINSCTKEKWEELFGENGTITKTSKANYWDVKPWMSNDNFIRGINTCIDRQEFAAKRGYVASNDYFGTAYMVNPENGTSYNSTTYHKKAMEEYYPDTKGFNLQASKIYFAEAVRQLVADNKLSYGTKSKPTEISITTWWMYESDIEEYGADVSKYIETAFNDESVAGGTIKLTVKNEAVAEWIDVYYKHLMVGQFDLGFGSISGNTLDPLNFLEVLFSSNSSGFTLNWGPDTSIIDPELQYAGASWSFEGLWNAADHGAFFQDGKQVDWAEVTFLNTSTLSEADGGTLKVEFAVLDAFKDDVAYEVTGLGLYLPGLGTLTLSGADGLDIKDNVISWNVLPGKVVKQLEDPNAFVTSHLETAIPTLPSGSEEDPWEVADFAYGEYSALATVAAKEFAAGSTVGDDFLNAMDEDTEHWTCLGKTTLLGITTAQYVNTAQDELVQVVIADGGEEGIAFTLTTMKFTELDGDTRWDEINDVLDYYMGGSFSLDEYGETWMLYVEVTFVITGGAPASGSFIALPDVEPGN